MTLSFKTTLSGAALLLASLLTPALAETAPSDTQAQIRAERYPAGRHVHLRPLGDARQAGGPDRFRD